MDSKRNAHHLTRHEITQSLVSVFQARPRVVSSSESSGLIVNSHTNRHPGSPPDYEEN